MKPRLLSWAESTNTDLSRAEAEAKAEDLIDLVLPLIYSQRASITFDILTTSFFPLRQREYCRVAPEIVLELESIVKRVLSSSPCIEREM